MPFGISSSITDWQAINTVILRSAHFLFSTTLEDFPIEKCHVSSLCSSDRRTACILCVLTPRAVSRIHTLVTEGNLSHPCGKPRTPAHAQGSDRGPSAWPRHNFQLQRLPRNSQDHRTHAVRRHNAHIILLASRKCSHSSLSSLGTRASRHALASAQFSWHLSFLCPFWT
jgi:hypothetical protein